MGLQINSGTARGSSAWIGLYNGHSPCIMDTPRVPQGQHNRFRPCKKYPYHGTGLCWRFETLKLFDILPRIH